MAEVQHLADVIADAKLRGISAGNHSLARCILDAGYRRGDGGAAALRAMADEIDRGPTFPLPPSVISALVRERADGLEGGSDG